jgi:hypothetical protein
MQLALLWQPGPPQPYQLVRNVVVGAATEDPPFPGTNWLNGVLRAWQPGPPTPWTIPPRQTEDGPFVPPVPPEEPPSGLYGPALTPAQRRRWFDAGTSSAFESPQEREARRAAIERLQRIEIGLLEPDAPQEAIEALQESIEEKVAAVLPALAARPMGRQVDYLGLVEKVVAAVASEMKAERRKLELEREEAIAILLSLM